MNKLEEYTMINWYLFSVLYLSYLAWPSYYSGSFAFKSKVHNVSVEVSDSVGVQHNDEGEFLFQSGSAPIYLGILQLQGIIDAKDFNRMR